jgi:DNA-binding NarL/FixJ family response regulator/anti-sigma regulatory factor (Ser/Thr protein kinase)
MPIVLLVDDSEVDRRLMAGLLNADVDWLVSHARNGVEAVEMMSDASPDVVVTDMLMPEMDGMQLVRQLGETYPDVPVILVTGQEDASLAHEALRQGAASYVPKSKLAEKLLETVEQVLSLRDADHFDDRLVRITTNTRYRFALNNDPSLIAPLIDRVQQGMIGMQLCSTAQRMHIGIALEEALINALYHGNLELPPHRLAETRQLMHEGKPSDLVEERRRQSPYSHRQIHVAADFTRQRAQFVVGDEGSGFDSSAALAGANMSGGGGRGLYLMQTFMDEVAFNATGNEVRLTLHDLRPLASAGRDGGNVT